MTAALVGGRPAPEALLLSGGEIRALMEPGDWLAAAEIAFRAAAEGSAQAPPPMTLEGQGGAFHVKGATLARDGRRFAAVKLNGNFPANPGARDLPTIQGAILLCDGETGCLLAIMDSVEVTLRRTAAASALAARHLARPESESLFVCGCGEQGRAHLAALREVLPLRRAYVFDRDPARADGLVRDCSGDGITVEAVAGLDAARRCDVVVTCTTASEAFLDREVSARGRSSPRSARTARARASSRPPCWRTRSSSPTGSTSAR